MRQSFPFLLVTDPNKWKNGTKCTLKIEVPLSIKPSEFTYPLTDINLSSNYESVDLKPIRLEYRIIPAEERYPG